MEIFRTYEQNGKVLQLARNDSETSVNLFAALPPAIAPGTGDFEIGPIGLSAEKIAPGESITMTVQITGTHIAYIYTEMMLLDKELNQVYGPVVREHVLAEKSTEISGVSHPDWSDTINLSVSLTPSLRLLTDGTNSAFAFLTPESYASPDYRLDGLYTSADGKTKRRARVKFGGDGETKSMVLFKDAGIGSAPHALTPNPNDQFSPFARVFHLPTEEDPAWQTEPGFSTSLTFGDLKLRWVAQPPLPGDYLVGLLIQDIDGQLIRKYAPLTIGA